MHKSSYRSKPYIYTVNVPDSIEENQIQSFLYILPREEKRRLLRIKNKIALYQSLLGKILIRYVLIKKYNYTLNNINIRLSEFGKPYLADKNNVHFNIAHSHNKVAVIDRKSTRLNSSHVAISYAVFCWKKYTSRRAGKILWYRRYRSYGQSAVVSWLEAFPADVNN